VLIRLCGRIRRGFDGRCLILRFSEADLLEKFKVLWHLLYMLVLIFLRQARDAEAFKAHIG
jgi:hypothetical protein